VISSPYHYNVAYLAMRSIQRLTYEEAVRRGWDVSSIRCLLWLLCYTHDWLHYFMGVISFSASDEQATNELRRLFKNELRLTVLTTNNDKREAGNYRAVMQSGEPFARWLIGSYFPSNFTDLFFELNGR